MPITTKKELKRIEDFMKDFHFNTTSTEENRRQLQLISYHNAINKAESERLQSEAACRNMYRKYHG